ncbi:putative permease [Candidatus Methanoperedens nitroreducens]|uniref:Probable membrane transporter protein n=1 Tax=Candidatus Methanoperedens nitratireducens TaxID=1392998 RepID=A0A062V8R1_9EURY|nr:sulfite exporter TauE/SafE family protein [Candidatus Methanoperedens nitroreducens]KCZ73687.1 putative permease [Candidatus Methanoperedens nitroreducens]MDJ1422354.1 sulfite exporter TauE/SafE family protein [Candidatus Methanoperedens sp.]
MDDIVLLSILIFATGLLYSSVGHAGASGYLAAMALFGLAPEVMKPTALVLNILVATIATAQFRSAGSFSWNTFWPFAMSSIPFAFIGGTISLPGSIYRPVVGIVLLFAAYRLFQYRQQADNAIVKPVSVPVAALFGAGIGLLSGAIGVGGGIFLSPLLLFMGWAQAKQTAGVAAAFILVNSIAGIAGHLASVRFLPDAIYLWALAAVLGGIIGSGLGSRKLANATLYYLLAAVLVIAGAKFIVQGL